MALFIVAAPPIPCDQNIVSGSSLQNKTGPLLLLLRSLSGLGTPGLPGGSLLLSLLGAADGADTGNSILADISTVSVLGGLAGDTLVDPG